MQTNGFSIKPLLLQVKLLAAESNQDLGGCLKVGKPRKGFSSCTARATDCKLVSVTLRGSATKSGRGTSSQEGKAEPPVGSLWLYALRLINIVWGQNQQAMFVVGATAEAVFHFQFWGSRTSLVWVLLGRLSTPDQSTGVLIGGVFPSDRFPLDAPIKGFTLETWFGFAPFCGTF